MTNPAAFIFNEWTRRESLGRYSVRAFKTTVHLRHPYVDLWIFDEVFHQHCYELPPRARQHLTSLGRPVRILDLGGHVGLAGSYFRSVLPGAEITSFEPDPPNREVLLRTITANNLQGSWRVVAGAAAARDGVADFVSDRHLSRLGHSTHPATHSERVQLVDVFPYLYATDFVKMDIQGGEWDILADDRFLSLRVPVLVLEVHPQLDPTRSTTFATAVARLEAAGYDVGPVEHRAEETTMWALKRDLAATPEAPEPASRIP